MPQLVILSGKGGTGKTSLSACLAHLAAEENPAFPPVLVDADVDAANLELLLDARRLQGESFPGGAEAVIDQDLCGGCGRCKEVCRFHAIREEGGLYLVDPIACDGCAACLYECPEGAISLKIGLAGEWYVSDTRYGPLFHAHLFPAQENSGKLVAHIKRQARKAWEESGGAWMLVDGPPGIGCPVISAISGADGILAVAEPSLAGIHDLDRILETGEYFQVPAWVCINKADLYPEGAREIQRLAARREITLLGEIPYDLDVARAMTAGQPVTEYAPDGAAASAIKAIWEKIADQVAEGEAGDGIINLKKMEKN